MKLSIWFPYLACGNDQSYTLLSDAVCVPGSFSGSGFVSLLQFRMHAHKAEVFSNRISTELRILG